MDKFSFVTSTHSHSFKDVSAISQFCWSPYGDLLFSYTTKSIKAWDLRTDNTRPRFIIDCSSGLSNLNVEYFHYHEFDDIFCVSLCRGHFNNCSQTSKICSFGEKCTLSFNLYSQFCNVCSLSHISILNFNPNNIINSDSLLLWSSQRSKCTNQISTPWWQSMYMNDKLFENIHLLVPYNIHLVEFWSISFILWFVWLFSLVYFFSLFVNFSFIHSFPPFSLDCKLIAVDPHSTSSMSKPPLQSLQVLLQHWMFQRVLPSPTSHSIELSFIITLLKISFRLKKCQTMYVSFNHYYSLLSHSSDFSSFEGEWFLSSLYLGFFTNQQSRNTSHCIFVAWRRRSVLQSWHTQTHITNFWHLELVDQESTTLILNLLGSELYSALNPTRTL